MPKPEKVQLPIKIMLREVGEDWIAFIGTSLNDPEKLELASVKLAAVQRTPGAREKFIELCQMIMQQFIKDTLGQKPTVQIRNAPENDRFGNS